jgi:hypothetical protein
VTYQDWLLVIGVGVGSPFIFVTFALPFIDIALRALGATPTTEEDENAWLWCFLYTTTVLPVLLWAAFA